MAHNNSQTITSRADFERAYAIVTEQIQLTNSLHDALKRERDALQQQDVEAVEALAAEKSALIEKLQHEDNARSRLCLAAGFAADDSQMQRFVEAGNSGGKLQNAWDRLLQLAEDCRDLNNVNGAAIRLRQQHFAANLAVLSGVPLDHDTYTSHGASAVAGESRALATA